MGFEPVYKLSWTLTIILKKNLFWDVSKFLYILVVKLFPSFCDSDDLKKNECGYLLLGKCWIK